jgi:DUF4097 and DUF4098 domain-containing protein YvlB
MRIYLWAALAGAALAPCMAKADCKFEQQRTGGEDARGVTQVVLVAGAGDLEVRGSPDAKRIDAKGKACASSQELLDQIVLKTHREGATLYIEAIMPKMDMSFFGASYASLDLKVTLPDNVPVDAQDSSGDSTLESLKSLKMLDSSGDLKIRRIAGAVDLQDSSGDIEMDHVGSVTLRDSSGDIDLDNVTGNVEILVDSSGDIDIEEVAGNVHIAQDSSGEIEIAEVKGNVTVDADTSGGIAVRDVGGDFTVLADVGGGIRHDNVHGKVTVPESRH